MELNNIPYHLAIIPDGNRRWATARGLHPWQGHEEGAKRFREVAEAAYEAGVKHVTIWGGSEDNLRKRSPREVQALAKILYEYIKQDLDTGHWKKGHVAFRLVGKWKKYLPKAKALDHIIAEAEAKTKDCDGCWLTLLFGYDGQEEMLDACRALQKSKKSITKENLHKELSTGFLPPVDLVIRTGGEPHWSAGFMMWHTANSQFHFSSTLWPDFGKKELEFALVEYAQRGRRIGA